MPIRHDAEGPGRLQHRLRQLLLRRRPSGPSLRLPPRQSAIRCRVEEGRRRRSRTNTGQGFAGRFGAGLPPINDGSLLFIQHMISKMKPAPKADPGWRSSSTAPRFSRGRPVRSLRDTTVDHRERLVGSRRRPARPALLQHRHLHLLLDRHQPQGSRAQRQGPARRRPRAVDQDAQESGGETEAALGDRLPRSSASTATSRSATGSRSFPTSRSVSFVSRLNGRSKATLIRKDSQARPEPAGQRERSATRRQGLIRARPDRTARHTRVSQGD